MNQETHDVRATASEYCRRGWALIPIPPGRKAPNLMGWQQKRFTEAEIDCLFDAQQNIGVLLGEPSGGLIDIDLDVAEAAAAAPALLPDTQSRSVANRD